MSTVLDEFEAAWRDAPPAPELESYLIHCESQENGDAWAELLKIDLEYRWRRSAKSAPVGVGGTDIEDTDKPPIIEDYFQQFSQLENVEDCPVDLIGHEYYVRHVWGDRPERKEYIRRFPGVDGIEQKLQEIDAQHSTKHFSIGPDETAVREGQVGAGEGGASEASRRQNRKATPRSLGDYELYEQIGRGGMGIVYRARQISVDRPVALKLLRTDRLDDLSARRRQEAISRFENEALATARLQHESIVTVYEVGEEDGRNYLAMQFVDGESLDKRLVDGPLEMRQAALLMRHVADAVHEAHRHAILHRDLKPHNILVDSRSGRPLVADFGLAKLLDAESAVTMSGEIFGTPAYMSPEQARETGSVTVSSDVYSIGATLYHVITGRAPFGGSPPDVLRKLADEAPTLPTQLNAAVDRDLETICLKCLEKAPDLRYASCSEVVAEFDRFLAGEPILARPVSRPQRLWRWAKRNPVAAGLSIAVLLLLISLGFLGGILRQLNAVRQHRDEAVSAESQAKLAEQQKKTLLAESYATSGDLALNRSQHQKAVEFYDMAIAEGFPNPIDLQLKKVEALVALKKIHDAATLVDAITKQSLASRQKGQVLLWRAEFAMGPRPGSANPELLLRQALKEELSKADRLYAEGLLESTSPRALKKFQAALKLEPFHHRAMGGMVMMQLTLGKLDDALEELRAGKRIFPHDPIFSVLEATVLALQVKPEAAKAALATARVGDAQKREFGRILEFMHQLVRRFSIINANETLANSYEQGFALLLQNKTVIPVMQSGVHFPPVIAKAFDGLPQKFLALRFGQVKPFDEALAKVVKVHPEGTLLAVHGHTLAGQSRFGEAVKVYQQAMQSGFVIPSAKRELKLALAFSAAAQALVGNRGKPGKVAENNRLLDLAVQTIREIPPDPKLVSYYHIVFCRTLQVTENFDLLRPWLDAWEQTGTKDGRLFTWKMDLEMKTGHPLAALNVANSVLKSNPKDVNARRVREQALRQIQLRVSGRRVPLIAPKPKRKR